MPDASTLRPRAAALWRHVSAQVSAAGATIWIALAALALVCAIFQPSTLSSGTLLGMLPFAAILAIAAIGQGLTVQQGGFDFSVAGAMSLSAVIVTGHAAGDSGLLFESVLFALGAVLIAGLVNGLAIAVLNITPIIATLAVNALLIGAVQTYTNGVPRIAPDNLSEFAIDKTFGIPNTVLIAVLVVLVAWFVLSRTTIGRRFVAVGTNARSARAAGIPVGRYIVGTYMLAALCYGIAGIILAGYVRTPNIDLGNTYLLASITAVVIGGTPLGGGIGRPLGTAAAAVFLSQLNVLIDALGARSSVSLLIQSLAIAIAVALGNMPAIRAAVSHAGPRLRRPRLRPRRIREQPSP